VSLVAAGAIGKAALRRGVQQVAGPERDLSGAWDAKVAAGQAAARRKSEERQGAPQQVQWVRRRQTVPAQRVWRAELQARELQFAEALEAQVSPPRVRQVALLPEQSRAQRSRASEPALVARARQPEQERQPRARVPGAF
jgi:hypothetical protein